MGETPTKRHSRVARIPLSGVHYRFSRQAVLERRLRNRAAEGNDAEVRRLIGAGADVDGANEEAAAARACREWPELRAPPAARQAAAVLGAQGA